MTPRPPLQGRAEAVFERFVAGRTDDLHPEDRAEAERFWTWLGGMREPVFEPAPRRRAPALRWIAAAAAVLLVATFAGWQLLAPGAGTGAAVAYQSARGELRTLDLADASVVSLGGGSAVETLFTRGERRVRLTRGEALFKVAHDAARPFVVETPEGEVTAVGTEFTVRLNPSDVSVTVVEGVVKVAPRSRKGSEPALVRLARAGDRIRFGTQPAQPDVGFVNEPVQVDPNEAAAWRQGYLYFRGEPLEEAIAVSNRYSDTPIVLADKRLARMPIYAVVRAGETSGLRDLVAQLEREQKGAAPRP